MFSRSTSRYEELVAGSPSQRNWKGIAIALLVIFVICSLIAAGVFFLTPSGKDGKSTGTKFNLSEILLPRIQPHEPNVVWISGHALTYRDENRTLWKLEVLPREQQDLNGTDIQYSRTKLLDPDVMLKYSTWTLSPDAKYAAMFTIKHKFTRRSSSKYVQIFETETSNHKPLHDGQPIKLVQWAPISYPAALAYVDADSNIWYQRDAFDPSSRLRITSTGSLDNFIYNGISDWLYEEEIFENDRAMYFSDSGTKLAYVTLNDTLVKRINLDIYTEQDNYPQVMSIPYPKVGELLPNVTLHVYFIDYSLKGNKKRAADDASNKTVLLRPPVEVESLEEYYLISGHWLANGRQDSETFAAIWSNRVQNVSFISTCLVPNKFRGTVVQCKLDYSHTYHNNWITPSLTKIEYSSNNQYFTILPNKFTDTYYYAHLAYFNYTTNSQNIPRFITFGSWEVTEIVGFNAENKILYFIAAYPTAYARHLMSVNLNQNLPAKPECLSCHLAAKKNECNFVSAKFPPSALTLNNYALYCLGPGIPKIYLKSLKDDTMNSTLVNNTKYAAYISTKLIPSVRYETIDLGDGYEAQVKLLLPTSAESMSPGDSYPLILKTYGGPGSQSVSDQWGISFDTYLVTNRNYIVAYIDGRGSGNRGSKYTEPLYRNFGTVEVQDQITTMRLLENITSYIRRDNIAVWGWSYGGFTTAHIVKQDRFKTFKCAASVAPVTNFLYYDAAYTERYMGLNKISDNYDGYKKTIVGNDVSAFALGRYLLAHGTGDDNVHFQNTAILVEALASRNIQFQFMAYTNQQHSIHDNLYHLYTMLDNFFLNCFQSVTPAATTSSSKFLNLMEQNS